MGILTRLRNAFGRPRKSQTAEAEGAAQTTPAEPTISETTPTAPAATPKVPSPSPEPTPGPTATVPEPRDDEHDLVSAAFDKVAVPRPADSTESAPTPTAETPRAEAEEAPPVTEKTTETASVTDTPAAAEKPTEAEAETPAAAEEPAPVEETVEEDKSAAAAEPAPADETEAPTDTKAETEPEPDAAAEPAAADGDSAPQGPPAADDETSTGGAGGNKTAEGEAEAAQKTAEAPAPEPAAADGDPAPQGPPAADDETSTGGAGGNKTAEGEAEAAKPTADAKPKRKPTKATKAAPKATPKTTPKPDTEPKSAEEGPALPLTRVKTRAPGLTTAYKAATATLDTHNLTGTRAKVYLVLDRSASMRPYYKDGSAQALAEQTLALAAHLDPEATVPVVFFSTELDGTGEITLTDHENKIDDLHAGLGRMGRTSYHAAVEAVLAHHDKTAADPTTPALVVFQTDGAPDAKTPATQALTDAAKTHPTVFFSFVAFGDPENKAFDYLRKLKTPNTSHFLAGETPRELTDKELYEGVLANWRP
ncbi:VWA domain-containing protein [Streptomyces massasporeus]|uniref:VWA domain-containing protein n=1 Tax=Streptomyces massasporeus TaxID=67324 RepID=UPI0036A83E1D